MMKNLRNFSRFGVVMVAALITLCLLSVTTVEAQTRNAPVCNYSMQQAPVVRGPIASNDTLYFLIHDVVMVIPQSNQYEYFSDHLRWYLKQIVNRAVSEKRKIGFVGRANSKEWTSPFQSAGKGGEIFQSDAARLRADVASGISVEEGLPYGLIGLQIGASRPGLHTGVSIFLCPEGSGSVSGRLTGSTGARSTDPDEISFEASEPILILTVELWRWFPADTTWGYTNSDTIDSNGSIFVDSGDKVRFKAHFVDSNNLTERVATKVHTGLGGWDHVVHFDAPPNIPEEPDLSGLLSKPSWTPFIGLAYLNGSGIRSGLAHVGLLMHMRSGDAGLMAAASIGGVVRGDKMSSGTVALGYGKTDRFALATAALSGPEGGQQLGIIAGSRLFYRFSAIASYAKIRMQGVSGKVEKKYRLFDYPTWEEWPRTALTGPTSLNDLRLAVVFNAGHFHVSATHVWSQDFSGTVLENDFKYTEEQKTMELVETTRWWWVTHRRAWNRFVVVDVAYHF